MINTKLLHLLFTLCLGITLFSCNNEEQYLNIIGKWECAHWIVPSTGKDNCENNTVSFHFKKDLTYSYTYGSHSEQGVYKIANNSLYSTPEGKLEIGVRIHKLTSDSLEMIMSRSGNQEILTLIKQP